MNGEILIYTIKCRKLLAKVLLPKEAQQIDRAMEDFAKRYYECNPGLVDNPGKEGKKKIVYYFF